MNSKEMCHVMFDIETLSTLSDSAIMSVGMVRFNLEKDINYMIHSAIDIQSCLDVGLKVDGPTIDWWLSRPKETQNKLINKEKRDIQIVLKEIIFQFEKWPHPQYYWYVWSHSSCFDIVILENAFKACKMKIPWAYKNVRDTRTLFDLADYTYKAKGGHDALEDALSQVEAVQDAYKQLMKKEVNINEVKGSCGVNDCKFNQ